MREFINIITEGTVIDASDRFEAKTAIDNLDMFTNAYIEAAMWSSSDEGDETGGEYLNQNYTVQDIAPETLLEMVEDCRVFQEKYAEYIGDNYMQAGHDFWLTRVGHGAGFWDGDWPEPAATILTDACKEFGDYELYVGDDGKIYS